MTAPADDATAKPPFKPPFKPRIKRPFDDFQTRALEWEVQFRRDPVGLELYRKVISRITPDSVAQFQANHKGAGEQLWLKYGDFPMWVSANVQRAMKLGLHEGPARTILDIGCGGGHFLAVCRELGHTAIGIDVRHAVLADIAQIYGVDRRIEQVIRRRPIASKGVRFDLVTAIWTVFELIEIKPDNTHIYWDSKDWEYLLNDLAIHHLADAAKIYIEMNSQVLPDGSMAKDFDLLNWFVTKGAGVQFERAMITFENVKGGMPLSLPARGIPSVGSDGMPGVARR